MANRNLILGISYGHGDSSAAIIKDGDLVAAAEEERFRRVKHYGLYPVAAIEFCLKAARAEAADVDIVAIPRQRTANLLSKLNLVFWHPQWITQRKRVNPATALDSPLDVLMKRIGLKNAKVERVEHHMAHLYSARYLSRDKEVALASIDGMGDFVSASLGVAQLDNVKILERVKFPDSVGYFYTALTQFLGFPHYGDEYKLMGLSSFGKPKYVSQMTSLLRDADPFGWELNREVFPILQNPIEFWMDEGRPKTKPFYQTNLLTQILGVPPRKPSEPILDIHHDLAKSVQVRFEEVASRFLCYLHELTKLNTVAIAGGCAHNSVWVGKILETTPFTEVHVAPAAHDAGIAVGAAMAAAKRAITTSAPNWALLGPIPAKKMNEERVKGFTEMNFFDEATKLSWLADELASQKIVGVCRDRMEFGPRALGNRSILADPRAAEMKERLNGLVKHREAFRPFAASVQYERQADWFKNAFFCPYMEAVFEVHEAARHKIAGVVHADNSCRIQSVVRDTQPFYWDLLEAFRKRTGVPMLINTSFNDQEPIVCTAEDAIRCYANTGIDHLVIGDRVFSKTSNQMSETA